MRTPRGVGTRPGKVQRGTHPNWLPLLILPPLAANPRRREGNIRPVRFPPLLPMNLPFKRERDLLLHLGRRMQAVPRLAGVFLGLAARVERPKISERHA